MANPRALRISESLGNPEVMFLEAPIGFELVVDDADRSGHVYGGVKPSGEWISVRIVKKEELK